jgi:DNA-binding PadR family transcriptional regulator
VPLSGQTSYSLASRYYTEYTTGYANEVFPVSVRHALLALLADGPKFGLRLQQEFEERTGEVWPLNVGQVYTTLQRLERDGLVESDHGEGPQKDFRITSEGQRELETWLRTPPEADAPPRDELVIKVLVAIHAPDVDVHQVVQAHRRHVVEVMQRYTRIKAEAAQDDVPLALVVDAELFRLEGVVRWLDAADARIGQKVPTRRTGNTTMRPFEPMPEAADR